MWFFFGILCMVNNPTDCNRIVFDKPTVIANYASGYDGRPAPSWTTKAECLKALHAEFAHAIPLKVMGSRWANYGCTEK